jgi:hypothetical protein
MEWKDYDWHQYDLATERAEIDRRYEALKVQKRMTVNTPENRDFAKRVYEAAMQGIDHVLKMEGRAKALTLSQNPQGNAALMAVLREAHGGQYFLAQTMIVDSMVDAPAYINGEPRNEYWMVNNWDADVEFVVSMALVEGDSEIKYLDSQSQVPKAFGPKNKAAARAVLAAYAASHQG